MAEGGVGGPTDEAPATRPRPPVGLLRRGDHRTRLHDRRRRVRCIGPAAAAAGSGLLIGLVVAAAVAYCNALLGPAGGVYPRSGGTYVYGRERLGDFWGYLAGWGFVVGKTASCAAMALTFGAYTAPGWRAPGRCRSGGPGRGELPGRAQDGGRDPLDHWHRPGVPGRSGGGHPARWHGLGDNLGSLTVGGARGVLEAAGLLFFAFAGYARIATLGEEVVDPARTIPRAIPTALGIALVVYGAVAVAALLAAGPVPSPALRRRWPLLHARARSNGSPRGPGGWRCSHARGSAVARGRREPHGLRHGRRSRPAAVARRRPPAPQGAPPGRDGGGDARCRPRAPLRPQERHRLQLLHRADLLRHHQCLGVDAAHRAASPAPSPGRRRGARPRCAVLAFTLPPPSVVLGTVALMARGCRRLAPAGDARSPGRARRRPGCHGVSARPARWRVCENVRGDRQCRSGHGADQDGDELVDANTALWTVAVAAQVILAPLAVCGSPSRAVGPAARITPSTLPPSSCPPCSCVVSGLDGRRLGAAPIRRASGCCSPPSAWGPCRFARAAALHQTRAPLLAVRSLRPPRPGRLEPRRRGQPRRGRARPRRLRPGHLLGNVAIQSTLQLEAPPDVRGRVFALFDVLWQSARLLSLAAGGLLADAVGVRAVYVGGGLLVLAAFAVGWAGATSWPPRGDTSPATR